MKVTTELKNIVKGAFAKKAEEYRKSKLDANHREYESAVEWLENTREYQDYVTALDRLKVFLTPDIEARNKRINGSYPTAYYYQCDFSKKASVRNIIYESPNWRLFENDEELKKLELEQNALLVKLTYEKDMDRIQALLSSYGIEI